MQIVTGYTGEAHITSSQDRAINQGIVGGESYILSTGSKMAATAASANEIRIADGVLMMQGCAAVIPKGSYDSVTIASGTAGYNRSDIICARYTRDASTDVENVELVVIQGNPVTSGPGGIPDYNHGDIQAGDTIVDFPLYRVWLTGVNVAITALATIVTGTAAQAAQINSINLSLQAWSLRLNNVENTLEDLIITKSYTSPQITVAGGGRAEISASQFAATTPAGYTPIGILSYSNSSSRNLIPYQITPQNTGNSAMIMLVNVGTASVTATVTIRVNYMRTSAHG